MGQVQPLQYRDIQQADGLNLQGTRQTIYLRGRIDGLVRATNKGGDLITDTSTGLIWLVAVMAEVWPDWCRAIVTLQDQPGSCHPMGMFSITPTEDDIFQAVGDFLTDVLPDNSPSSRDRSITWPSRPPVLRACQSSISTPD